MSRMDNGRAEVEGYSDATPGRHLRHSHEEDVSGVAA